MIPSPPLLRIACLLAGLWLLALTGCRAEGVAEPTTDLTVFAAASLTDAFTDVAARFEAAHPGARVTLNFAGSQQLAQQIAQGAPGDVFASANEAQMAAAITNGRVDADAPRPFARNRLAVIIPEDNPAGLHMLADLGRAGVKVILAAPGVPAGRYARDFLARASEEGALGADFAAAVMRNVVSYEQNVRVVLTKVALGEADAGIVYASDTHNSPEPVNLLPIPNALNPIASYPVAPLNDSPHPQLAAAFIAYLLSPVGQAVLGQYGFLPPQPPSHERPPFTITAAPAAPLWLDPQPAAVDFSGAAAAGPHLAQFAATGGSQPGARGGAAGDLHQPDHEHRLHGAGNPHGDACGLFDGAAAVSREAGRGYVD